MVHRYSGTYIQWYIHTVVHTHSGTYTQWYIHTVVDSHSGIYIQWYIHTVVHTYSTHHGIHIYIGASFPFRAKVILLLTNMYGTRYLSKYTVIAADMTKGFFMNVVEVG